MTAVSERASGPPAAGAPASAPSSSSSRPSSPATIRASESSETGCSKPAKKKWWFALPWHASSSSDSTQKLARREPNMPLQLDNTDSRSFGASRHLLPQGEKEEGTYSTSVNCSSRLRWIIEKLSSET